MSSANILFIGLFLILAVALGAIVYKNVKAGGSLSDVVADGGFDRSKIISTDKTVNPDTGAVTTTQTDSNGKKLVTTTDANGTTKSSVTGPNGEPLSAAEISAMEKFEAAAPKMAAALGLGIGKDIALLFGASLIATATREIAESGVKTGLKQTAKIVGSQGAEAVMKFFGFASKEAIDKAVKAAAGSSAEIAARAAAKEVLDEAAEKAGKGIADKAAREAAEKAAREAASQAAEAAAEKAAEKELARVAAMKGAKTAGEKATVKLAVTAAKTGVKAGVIAAKAGVMAAKLGSSLAKMVSMGPVGVVLMAIDIVSLALDLACCGGYCNVVEAGKYEKMRDEYKGNIQAYLDDTNKELVAASEEPISWPVVWGPIDKLDEATLNEKLGAKVSEIMNDPDHPIMVPIITKLKEEVAAGRVKTSAQVGAFITDNVDTAAIAEAAKVKLCPELGGKIVDNKWCSWGTKASCDGSFKWPIGETNKTEHYVTWDEAKQACNKDPLSGFMRGLCEGTKGKDSDAGFPWDPIKNICTINEAYCLGKSMQWDGAGNKCTLSKGQEVAEMLFGTTFVRGLNQLYDAKQYEDCPPGSRPAREMAALAGVGCSIATVGMGAAGCAVMASVYIGQTQCSTDKCPDGQARQSGLCYEECKKATPEEKTKGWNDFTAKAMDTPGAQGIMIQGMCYRCPPGYYKSAPGMCQVELKTTLGVMSKCPDGFTDSGLFCNVKTRNIGIGKPMSVSGGACSGGGCKTECPKFPKCCCKTVCSKVSCAPVVSSCSSDRDKIDGLCYAKCNTGEEHVPGMPYLCRKSGGLLVQEKMKIGVCPPDKDRVGAQCFKRCTEYGPGWTRTVEGTCRAPVYQGLEVIATAGKKDLSYSREPLGISYKVFPRKRKIPLGKGPKGC